MAGDTMTHPYTLTDAMFQVLRLLILGSVTLATSSVSNFIMGGKSGLLLNVLVVILSFFQYYLLNLAFNSFVWATF